MEKIFGREISLEGLLKDKKYTIHYYQREYRWGRKQVAELINDLTDEFNTYYSEGDSRAKGQEYGYYYLGSVILTKENEDVAIIDGQQRLTSLTLLLIYLNTMKQQKFPNDDTNILSMIHSSQYGVRSFNMNVEERIECLDKLMKGELLDIDRSTPPSVVNIVERYQDIVNEFPEYILENALLHFIDWLMKKVYFVRIFTETEQDAHKVFVTMNDRGLSLTPNEMLKGYLLSAIERNNQRHKADKLWKQQIAAINDIDPDNKELDDDFVKNWLRAQYAESIRMTVKGASPEDFDLIGTEAHKWLLTNAKRVGLNESCDYEKFVLDDFKLFSNVYIRLRQYSTSYKPEFACVYYNANRNFTLQYQLILASICPEDKREVIDRKIKTVSCFIDQYITRRVMNYRSCDYSTIKNAIFNLTKDFRRLDIDSLKAACLRALDSMDLDFEAINNFRLNQFTKRYMLHMLARMTYFSEQESDVPQSSIEAYLDRRQANSYDIEHIIRSSYVKERSRFDSEEDFESSRNQFGALILLPKEINRSLKDRPYSDKVIKYAGENLLARSLSDKGYVNSPRFKDFIDRYQLSFRPIIDFDKQAIAERSALYKQLVEIIWDKEIISSF